MYLTGLMNTQKPAVNNWFISKLCVFNKPVVIFSNGQISAYYAGIMLYGSPNQFCSKF